MRCVINFPAVLRTEQSKAEGEKYAQCTRMYMSNIFILTTPECDAL